VLDPLAQTSKLEADVTRPANRTFAGGEKKNVTLVQPGEEKDPGHTPPKPAGAGVRLSGGSG